MEPKYNQFDSSIPGESLTTTPGNSAWETPPQYTDIEDAQDAIWKGLTKPRTIDTLIMLAKQGVDVQSFTQMILMAAFQEGKITPDMVMLMFENVSLMIAGILKTAGMDTTKIHMNDRDDSHRKAMERIASVTAKEMDTEPPKGMMERPNG